MKQKKSLLDAADRQLLEIQSKLTRLFAIVKTWSGISKPKLLEKAQSRAAWMQKQEKDNQTQLLQLQKAITDQNAQEKKIRANWIC